MQSYQKPFFRSYVNLHKSCWKFWLSKLSKSFYFFFIEEYQFRSTFFVKFDDKNVCNYVCWPGHDLILRFFVSEPFAMVKPPVKYQKWIAVPSKTWICPKRKWIQLMAESAKNPWNPEVWTLHNIYIIHLTRVPPLNFW